MDYPQKIRIRTTLNALMASGKVVMVRDAGKGGKEMVLEYSSETELYVDAIERAAKRTLTLEEDDLRGEHVYVLHTAEFSEALQ